ncbi:tRNA modification GTPase MnmE [Sedimentisphaera cyanobacteriorum]|uniref:tRNA modification GTPase MnmE n=1 Tax=Sedimentisphaera cyanobacteriorum TaxID=1940790 RepID=A0A1Q2HSQ8_9BACT|nr:GTPase [Sedimentisphaera cyanobacteriorum]AQQ10478.1 tRNA modification GTPase MnmE [Sedimentisphaera cyanobacteriorum]
MTFASVTTPKTGAAISCVSLFGSEAQRICAELCRIAPQKLTPPKNLLARIYSSSAEVDEVVLGCLASDRIDINCHGNPIIVRQIVSLLEKAGAESVGVSEFMVRERLAHFPGNTIALEAEVYSCFVHSLKACEIIQNQAGDGLKKAAEDLQSCRPEEAAERAEKILHNTQTASKYFAKQRIAIAGVPNSGKSTLLNRLAGDKAAIVSDVQGTTRDWVSVGARLADMQIEFIDTAGLCAEPKCRIDAQSQRRSLEIARSCDGLIWLLDPAQDISQQLEHRDSLRLACPVITARTKADLSEHADTTSGEDIIISAQTGFNIDKLCDKLLQTAGTEDLPPSEAVCFTNRQLEITEKIAAEKGSLEQNIQQLTTARPKLTFDLIS